MNELKTFAVMFHGRKRQWTHGGEMADWNMTIEATDKTSAEYKVREIWEVMRELKIEEKETSNGLFD